MARKPSSHQRLETERPSLFPEVDSTAARVPADFPPSWLPVLADEFRKSYFAELQTFLAEERANQQVLPAGVDVFNAFRFTPFDAVKVVLLGQDPYPTPGHAHGLCFSVRPDVRPLPASLRNMFQELHADLGVLPSNHGCLASWAKQGVLLLNAVLTVRAGSPASHARQEWETFTDAVLRAVARRDAPAVFVLWGAYAQKKLPLVDTARHAVVMSAHPSPLSASAGFFGSKPFSKINAALERFGANPIDWRLPKSA